ncbi:CACNA1G [Symbiodinium necroappetens]|uniref:CACNA1G protein n=1 Tax=Symbiodinium necroappetens TaxID=1628268 RepID=A0A812LA36_9DINO|nr:CACNA1G [Symbiodinium necroappetens]
MDEEAGLGSVRGTAIGVYVEKPNKPGKVFKLRDVRTHGTSKDWPTASKEMPSRRSYGSQDYPRAADARRSRDPSPLPTPSTSTFRPRGLETPDSRRVDSSPARGRSGSPQRLTVEPRFPEERSVPRWQVHADRNEEDLYPRHSTIESRQTSCDSLRWTANVDPRQSSAAFDDRRQQSQHSQYTGSRRPSADYYGGIGASAELADYRRPPAPEPAPVPGPPVTAPPSNDDFRSWLAGLLESEREVVHEVIKGRHIEILSQVNLKLDSMGKPAAPSDMPKPLRVTPAPQQKGLGSQPHLPGVLVLREDWAAGAKDPETGLSAKKVSVTDDTDARSLGPDDVPVMAMSSLPPPERSIAFSEPDLRRTKSAGSLGRSDTLDAKSKGAVSVASSRMTQTIPHLRKNSLLEGLKELPFWHPGRYVHTTQFDAIFCGVILANTVVMALQMQYNGLRRGYLLGAPHFNYDASDYWPQAPVIFTFLDWVFGIVYCLEMIVKLIGFKKRFFQEWWNWFDGAIVLMWLVEVSLQSVVALDPAFLRMMRMARLLRLIRLVKTIQGFNALYIMTTAMMGSATCLFWSFMLLTTVQMMIAFFLNESLEVYFTDDTKPASEKLEVFEYFGTTARVMLTMFELTLANWPTAARILQENVTEWYSIFSVAYKLIVGFAAVGIINGVFMQETFKVAASDDKLMMRQKERDRSLHTKKMRTLFAAADESGDGFIDREEFCEIMNIPEVRTWLAAQELPVRDPNVLFSLLDDGDAELTAEELVKGVERLKGTAKGIDLAAFIAEYRDFASKVAEKLDLTLEYPIKTDDEDDDDDG